MNRRPKIITLTLALATLAVLALAWRHRRELWLEFRIWRDFESAGVNAQGYREYLHRETGILFVRLPGGTYAMGSTEEEHRGVLRFKLASSQEVVSEGFRDELPRHEVTLSPFLIAKYEVPQAQWRRVMGTSPSRFQGDDLPVEKVSWEDCWEFCRKTGLRLPTEAQWEYACRAGMSTRFSFGETITPEQVNYDGEFPYPGAAKGLDREKTVAVGSLPANDFGLCEMHGNVWEWCEDLYDEDFYKKAATRRRDPVCGEGSVYRVYRGGSWSGFAGHCRSAYRLRASPGGRYDSLGFRPSFPSSP